MVSIPLQTHCPVGQVICEKTSRRDCRPHEFCSNWFPRNFNVIYTVRERRRRGRRNGLIGRTSMLNERAGQFYKAVYCKVVRQLNGLIGRTSMLKERAGQFYKAVHCKVMRQLKRLKNQDDLAPKQNMYR